MLNCEFLSLLLGLSGPVYRTIVWARNNSLTCPQRQQQFLKYLMDNVKLYEHQSLNPWYKAGTEDFTYFAFCQKPGGSVQIAINSGEDDGELETRLFWFCTIWLGQPATESFLLDDGAAYNNIYLVQFFDLVYAFLSDHPFLLR